MIPHRNPSFLRDKSSPKQIKTPGSPPGVFIWGQPSAAGVTPHCAGAARPRRNHSEPESPSPPTASMKSSGAALFTACGPAMSCPARQFLPRCLPSPPLCRRVLPTHAKRPRTMAGSFSIPAEAGSAALLQAVDGKGIEPEALIKPESCLVAVGHTEFPGAALSPALHTRYLSATQKDPAQRRGLFYSDKSRISCASAGSRW